MKAKWLEMRLEVPSPLKDAVINRAFELGAEGVTEETDPTGTVVAYFNLSSKDQIDSEMSSYVNALAEMHPGLARVKTQWREIEEDNWAERWKEHFRAQKLTNLFFLKPVWEKDVKVPPEMVPILLEPGQAFGTGLHPSTKLCIKLIEHAVDFFPQASRVSFLDVGTGSGILSIVGYKLGIRNITAIDVDPTAVETAEANCRLNDCKGIKIQRDDLAKQQGSFDIIVANILLETHKQLAPSYKKLLRDGGVLVLSGVLANQKSELEEYFLKFKLCEAFSETLQEWVAIGFSEQNQRE